MPFNKMSKEELKRVSSKGGKGKKKPSDLSVKDLTIALLNKDGNREKVILGIIESAQKGNAKSAELLLKMIGQDPSQKQETESDNPFE